jgi:propionyl-CoA carboxylase alpha chain
VEHPITELVSGEDLVEHMLWIGAGKPLPERLTKNPTLPFRGSAIESRVYAEDPKRKFLPSIGPLITYKEPETFSSADKTVRIDTGVFEGGVISMFYDPMIAKLCSHAKTRAEAIALQETALDQYVVQGLNNNISFLRSIFRNKK